MKLRPPEATCNISWLASPTLPSNLRRPGGCLRVVLCVHLHRALSLGPRT